MKLVSSLTVAVVLACGACDQIEQPEPPKLDVGKVATGAPEDFAEPSAQAVRIEARLAEAHVREHTTTSGAKVWSEGDATTKVVQPIPGGERTAWFPKDDHRPFLISEPDASFAFHQGRLTYVYDRDGRPVEITEPMRARAQAAIAAIDTLLTTP